VVSGFVDEDFRSSGCDWKCLLSCIEMDELIELGKYGKVASIADKGLGHYSYEHMHIDLYKRDLIRAARFSLFICETDESESLLLAAKK
jgi:hypothetical protein